MWEQQKFCGSIYLEDWITEYFTTEIFSGPYLQALLKQHEHEVTVAQHWQWSESICFVRLGNRL